MYDLIRCSMTSSMILSAEELENGEINRQNEIWIKPGKTFVVPITIDTVNTELCWEFTSQPKVRDAEKNGGRIAQWLKCLLVLLKPRV